MNDRKADSAVLDRLFAVIEARKAAADAEASYTARLLAEGRARVAQKMGEEAVETVIAGVAGGAGEVTRESADLLYHLLVLWAATGVAPADVWAELGRREGTSGHAEKAARGKGEGTDG
jgi:phosphoribosyl-ATP pyrophosphohydrolase